MAQRLLIVVGLIGSVALLGGITAFVDFQSRPRVAFSPVAERGGEVYAPGRVEGRSDSVGLRVRAAGQLVKLLVAEGHAVAAGDVLLEIEDAQPRHQRELAAAELAVAEGNLARLRNGARPQEKEEAAALWEAKVAELRRAELNWERTGRLLLAQASSAQEAERQRAEVDVLTALAAAAKSRNDLIVADPREDDVRIAQAHVRSAQARLALAQSRLDDTRLVALSGGKVLKVNVQVGELIGPDGPKPAIVTCDTSRLRVRAFLEESEALCVAPGAQATITADGLSGLPMRGVVSRLAPQMSDKLLWSDQPSERLDTRTREVWIDLHEAGEVAPDLPPGLPVEVTIHRAALDGQLVGGNSPILSTTLNVRPPRQP